LYCSGIDSNVLAMMREQVDQGPEIIDRTLSDVDAARCPDEELGGQAGW